MPITRFVCIALLMSTIAGGAEGSARPFGGGSQGSFELVGHNPLLSRGMNAALALHGDFAYVGSRTGGSHADAGVLVVDISDPADPQVVHQIGPPEEGNVGETSRELRVWPKQELLIILNFSCSVSLHACAGFLISSTIRFYDISGNLASKPRLVATYFPSRRPHEFFLWVDPFFLGRALLYMSTPSGSNDNILVTDISRARDGVFDEISSWRADFPPPRDEGRLHSLSVSVYGDRAYLAYLRSGFFLVDTSEIAANLPDPEIKLVAPLANHVFWPGGGPHSAAKVFNKRYVLVTDEVYGSRFGGGCPWGWVRVIDIRNEQEPKVVAPYRVNPHNRSDFCTEVDPQTDELASFASHNPTVLNNLAFITWHSAGLQAVMINNPEKPKQAAEFKPQPLPSVQTEDPALSSGIDKVVMWSYPIIKDGLIYVVDVRNGLYILRYEGPFAAEVAGIGFLEGNSNLGDALALEGPHPCSTIGTKSKEIAGIWCGLR